MSKKQKLNIPLKSHKGKLDIPKPEFKKPIIGITFLDKNKFGLKHLLDLSKNDNNILNVINRFLKMARSYGSIGELIKHHASHISLKNKDEGSIRKIKEINERCTMQIDCMKHIHCLQNGNGAVVLHGFQISNCFEIVWIDPKHEIYK